MIKLVIFDLDGTLLNSLNDLAASVNYALRKNGFAEHPLDVFNHFVGNGVAVLLERALPEEERSLENKLQLWKDFMHYYGLHKTDLTAPYDGISSLLEALKEQRIMLAVASNKFHSATTALVRSYFGEDTFQVVYGLREDVPPKPAPDVVFDILKDTDTLAEEALYVGDSGVDMETAANAGLKSIGVLWGYRSREELENSGAVFLVERPAEILDVVKKLE